MNKDEPESRWLDRLVALLREEPPVHQTGEERVMARVRAEAARTVPSIGAVHGRGWSNWFLRPRRICFSPLGLVAGALAALLVVMLGSWLVAGREWRTTPIQAAGPGFETGARPVLFVLLAPDAAAVSVAGDFNNWDPSADPLERNGAEGVWGRIVMLPAGVYSYAYVVDGEIRVAADARPAVLPGDFGIGSSVLVVGEGSI